MVVINLWWSHVTDFIKWFFLLVRIWSVQVGFIDLQQVGKSMRLSRSKLHIKAKIIQFRVFYGQIEIAKQNKVFMYWTKKIQGKI